MIKLPDGSGFFIGSLPLPTDHWIYAPRAEGWDAARDCSSDTPIPICAESQIQAVMLAMRWAIREMEAAP